MYQIRTDLALETQEKMQEDKVDLKGVRYFEEEIDKNLIISTVIIETENGAKTMGKPKGTYITIEAFNMDEEDEDYHREISAQLAKVIQKGLSLSIQDYLPFGINIKVFVVMFIMMGLLYGCVWGSFVRKLRKYDEGV